MLRESGRLFARIVSALKGLMLVFLVQSVHAEAMTPEAESTGADKAVTHLSALLAPLSAFDARFEQTLISAKGQELQRVSGSLQALRPGYFRWVTEAPLAQTLVADGEQVWIYDPDLEQVTVQPVNEQASNTPALLLSGQVASIAEAYEVSYIERPAGGSEAPAESVSKRMPDFRLVPKGPDSLFESLTLHFVGETLQAMTLEDSLGQKTLLRFSEVRQNPPLTPEDFSFAIPDGVDVIRQ